MKVDLSKYKNEWYKEDSAKNIYPGPVITISRELGCPAKKIACTLADELNKNKSPRGKDLPWRWISKEILSESAKAMNVDCDQIEHIFQYKNRNALEDLLMAQSKDYYKSDLKIRTTIAKVIRTFATNGNAIIVGRGGVAITRDIPKSLHVMLEAPLEWRAVRTASKHDLTLEQARNYAQSIDKKRKQFRDHFQGKGNDYTRFDIKFNCMTLETDVIVKIIIGAIKARGFI
ncbi:MAG: cytidylate kinase-like family protein [Bacteroidales bacterium]|nr:cytidylate kinase-like family protein [Bacteroidales bacterium]MDT8430615.1 cytidylate kinase-like family protein [Bacteroidales bacterium]